MESRPKDLHKHAGALPPKLGLAGRMLMRPPALQGGQPWRSMPTCTSCLHSSVPACPARCMTARQVPELMVADSMLKDGS